jgi:GntR family transcriptional regulator, transcriptional repressor for pyruvate dehydrogenase complex
MDAMNDTQGSKVEWLARAMLDRIRNGEWRVGSLVPGERVLMEQFGTSRIALREAMSTLRALGVLDTEHGRGSTVRRIDTTILEQLLPLMLSLEGEQPFEQTFELRLALESRTAYLAALRRTDDEMGQIDRLVDEFRGQVAGELGGAVATDIEFHMAVARAAHNPLFPTILKAVSEFVKYVQTISCANNPVRRARAVQAHESIAEAIRDRDAERARVEMESHLRYSALRILRSGLLEADADLKVPAGPEDG